MGKTMEKPRKTLGQLFVPICLETLCFMLTGMIDTLMLSSVSDQAVGAVGTANTYISIFIIMFSIILFFISLKSAKKHSEHLYPVLIFSYIIIDILLF